VIHLAFDRSFRIWHNLQGVLNVHGANSAAVVVAEFGYWGITPFNVNNLKHVHKQMITNHGSGDSLDLYQMFLVKKFIEIVQTKYLSNKFRKFLGSWL
jgi:hypothetical protein